MWVSGIELLTGTLATTAGGLGTSGTTTQAPWSGTNGYTGFWRCGLASALGAYATKWLYSDNTEITPVTNYTALGVTIDGSGHNQLLVSYQATGHIEFYSNQTDSSPKWTTMTETNASYAPIFASTGTASTSPMLCAFDLSGSGTAYPCTAGTFTITFGTDNTQTGTVFNITVS